MNRYRLLGGIFLLVLAALIFLILEMVNSIPVTVTLMAVGIALITTSRKKMHNNFWAVCVVANGFYGSRARYQIQ
jgi:hypothetical protein